MGVKRLRPHTCNRGHHLPADAHQQLRRTHVRACRCRSGLSVADAQSGGELVRDADVVHLHDCLYLPNLAAYVAARLARRPVIVTQHVGMVPYRNPVLRALLFLAYRMLGRIVLGGARQVVFVSESVRSYFNGFVRFRAPPLLVPNGVDTSVFRPADAALRARLREKLGVLPGQPLLLFVGRFVEKKGLPVLRELAARLGHARWVFAGWGPLDPERWEQPNVTVLRDLSSHDLVPLYQAADLLVLPSTGEGFPLVVQEAMSCGTPVITGEDTAASVDAPSDVVISCAVDGAEAVDRWESALRSALAGPSPAQGRSETHGNSCSLAMDLDGLRSCLRDHIREPA